MDISIKLDQDKWGIVLGALEDSNFPHKAVRGIVNAMHAQAAEQLKTEEPKEEVKEETPVEPVAEIPKTEE